MTLLYIQTTKKIVPGVFANEIRQLDENAKILWNPKGEYPRGVLDSNDEKTLEIDTNLSEAQVNSVINTHNYETAKTQDLVETYQTARLIWVFNFPPDIDKMVPGLFTLYVKEAESKVKLVFRLSDNSLKQVELNLVNYVAD